MAAVTEEPFTEETMQQTMQRLTKGFAELSKSYDANTEELKAQRAYAHRTRLYLIIACVGFLLDILVTGGLVLDHISTDHAIATANSSAFLAREGVVTSCNRGNQIRAKQEKVLDKILFSVAPLIPPMDVTKFHKLINGAYAPRDCGKIHLKTKSGSSASGVVTTGPAR